MKLNDSNLPPYQVLHDSDLLFNMVFNQQFQFMAILDPNGKVLDVNELAVLSQGVTREDYIGKLFWHSPAWCNFPEWESIWKARLIEASNTKAAVITEDVFQVEDGSIHYADASTTAIYTPGNNQLVGYIVQAIDTTKRHLIDNKIKENEARLTFVLEQSHIGNWELNLIDHTAHRSLKHDQIFGYDSLLPQWTYETFLEHVIPEDRADVDKKFQDAIKNQGDYKYECRIRRKDGEIRWILISGGHAFNSSGQVELMAGLVQDITKLKQAEIIKSHHEAELQSLFKALPDTYFRMKSDGTILDYQAQSKDELYIQPENFLGKRMQDILPKKIGALFQEKIDEIARANNTLVFKYELMTNNEVRYFDARLNRISINNQLICVIRDITEQNYLNERLEKAQKQAKLGSWEQTFYQNSDKLFWSNEVYSIFEYDTKSTMTFEQFIARVHPDDRDKVIDAFQSSIELHSLYHIEHRLLFSDGRIKYVNERAEHFYNENNKHIHTLGTVQDITEQKSAEENLQLFSRVFSDTHEGIIITDPQQRIIDVNPAFCQITGYSREEVLYKKPKILSSGKQSPQFYDNMWQSVNELGHWQGELWNRTKQGELYAELLNISSLTNAQNEVTHYVGVFSDITRSKRHQDQLNLMAHYDVLTKLPNRALFIDRFHQSIAHSIRTGHQLAVCFLDLDDFKPVNDNYGHEVGDRLLIQVAQRITSCIREEDTVSRQGGDEFAILLNDIKSASQYEGTITRIHLALAEPYLIDGIQHEVTASSGVTLYPSDDGDIDTLLRHADHAMYHSKLLGKHRFQLYSPDSDQRIIQKNLQLDEIEQALVNDEFQLYYQPKVNMVTGNLFGVEALIRWIHPEKGVIPPLEFLPLIDETALEVKVGEWVIKKALQQLDDWQQQGVNLEVSVNISSNHLLSSDFFVQLEKCLSKHPAIKSHYLQLEILESSALGDINTINHIIEACQNKLGVSFSLDDFGTGYSSLTHLRSLPVNTIKIDQSFVRDMLDDPSDYSIIEGVIALTNTFNRNVIAEGVESSEHGLLLLLMGCEKAQGYAIAKPMSAECFLQWLNDYTPNPSWLLYANKHRSHKEKSLEIFKIISERWKEKLRKAILSSPSDDVLWPIIDCKLSHSGNWIHRKKQERLFRKGALRRLKQAHDESHTIAKTMQHKYSIGEVETARAIIKEFELSFNEMTNAAESCE